VKGERWWKALALVVKVPGREVQVEVVLRRKRRDQHRGRKRLEVVMTMICTCSSRFGDDDDAGEMYM
jgi:hypothetical protein